VYLSQGLYRRTAAVEATADKVPQSINRVDFGVVFIMVFDF
jgi:hypothetical protein